MRAKFTDKPTGETFGFRHYGGKPEWVGMFSPKEAPEWTRRNEGRAVLDAIELFEKRKDA